MKEIKTLAEYSGETAMDITADLMPFIIIFVTDPEVMDAWQKENMAAGFKKMKDNHPDDYHAFLATYAGVSVEEFTVPHAMKAMTMVMRDPLVLGFFASPSQKEVKESSGSVMENIEEEE